METETACKFTQDSQSQNLTNTCSGLSSCCMNTDWQMNWYEQIY
jgi:hypothetical protein